MKGLGWKPNLKNGKFKKPACANRKFQMLIDLFLYIGFVKPEHVMGTFNALLEALSKLFNFFCLLRELIFETKSEILAKFKLKNGICGFFKQISLFRNKWNWN